MWSPIANSLGRYLKHPPFLLLDALMAKVFGNFRKQVHFGLVQRQPYAFGLLAAADIARFFGIRRITAVEFGVAEGAGLLNMCKLAEAVRAETGVGIDVFGFDTGSGLPPLDDYRDHPEIFSRSDFPMGDSAKLKSQLPDFAKLIIGDI